jgi:ABC-type multidrug transport system ATPase subunit
MRSTQNAVTLEFEELGLTLKTDGRSLLKGVTGKFQAGHMAAIMGPSGAGKTTFMNTLCGKAWYGNVTGKVWINGKDNGVAAIRPIMGFVPQDDIVHEELTVREQIFYSAQLRNPAGTSLSKINSIVEDVLNVMELCDVQHHVVGSAESRGISGGQRKRVSIGLELAACPSVLFLDEPTSGLDATVAMDVCHSLQRLTETGMTVVVVVHQPRYDLFTLFDDVLFLGLGGQTVYLGPSQGALPYFTRLGFEMAEHVNPADWFMDIISGRVGNGQIPNFEAQMLFELWNEKATDLHDPTPINPSAPQEDAAADNNAATANQVPMQEEEATPLDGLRNEAEARWDAVDTSHKGLLDKMEVVDLLEACTGSKLDLDVAEELFRRMRGTVDGPIKKSQFLEFVINLTRNVACDGACSSTWEVEVDEDVHIDIECGKDVLEKSSEGSDSCQSRCKPPLCQQFSILLQRGLLRWKRQTRQAAVGAVLMVAAALVFGDLSKGKINVQSWEMPSRLEANVLALGLLTAISCLNVFGSDRQMFWRESASGISVAAFYSARVTISFVDVQIQCIVFSVAWWLVAQPEGGFWLSYQAFRMLAFSVAAWGYVISAFCAPENMTLGVAVIILLLGAGISDPIAIASTPSKVQLLSPFTWSYGTQYLRVVDFGGGAESMNLAGKHFEEAFRDLIPQTYLGYGVTMQVVLLAWGALLHLAGYVALKYGHRHLQN